MQLGSLFSGKTSGDAVKSRCPDCRAEIPLDDINVAKDLALCRACGKTWPFSSLQSVAEVAGVDLSLPPRGVRVETGMDGSTVITYRRLSGALLFLVPFTALWSGGSMAGIYGTQIARRHFDWKMSLFGLPFLAGTVVLCSVITFMLFGKWKITVRRGEGTVFVGVGGIGRTRRFDCGPGTRASLEASSVRVNNQSQEAIVVSRAGEKLLTFGAALSSRDVKLFIAAAMNRAF
jgi:hypothetical protein